MTSAPSPKNKSLWQEFVALKKLWPFLRDQKRQVIIGVILIPVIAVVEMYLPLSIKWSIDEGISKGNWDNLKLGAMYYFGLVFAQYISRSLQTLSTSFAVHRMIQTLRRILIKHILDLSCSYHDRTLSGTLVTRASSDFDNLSESLNLGVLTAVIDLAVLAGSIFGLFYLNWQLALSAFVVLPIVFVVVSVFSKALKKAMLNARVKIAALNAFTQECLYGNITIKLLNAEKAAQKKYDNLNEEYRVAQMSSVVLDAFMFSIIDGLTSITVGVVLYFAVLKAGLGSAMFSAGVMVAFVQYIQQMFEPLKQLGNKMAMLQGAFTSIERIFGVLDQKTVIHGNKTVAAINGHVEFRNVTFSYKKDSENKILKDLNFQIEPGQSLAIVGATGSGKSTIIKLLSKLYEGYTGKILIDDMDLAELDGDSLRRQLAIVPQDIILFDGDISFNIGLGSKQITDADIQNAAHAVGADLFIENLPGKYQFPLREQGSNLSHGQRQLLSFARALAKKPSLIVLDEATSSVDPESEHLVQRGIEKLLQGRTVIVIAHRLSTIRKCDKILVVDSGKIIEQGSHDALLKQQGRYFQLHHALLS